MNEDEMNTEENEVRVVSSVAEDEFWRWVEAMDLRVPQENTEDNDDQKGRVIAAIERGELVIDDSGFAIFTPQRPGSKHKEPLKFHEPGMDAWSAMDKHKNKFNNMCEGLGVVTKTHPSVFRSKIIGEDLKVCFALMNFLMA